MVVTRGRKLDEASINKKKSRLIQMVKENPILNDLININHKNSEMKKIIWDQVAAELNEDGEHNNTIFNNYA